MALAQSRTHDGQINQAHTKKGYRDITDDPLEPTVQGAILLQSLLRLDEPHNLLVTERYARRLDGIFAISSDYSSTALSLFS